MVNKEDLFKRQANISQGTVDVDGHVLTIKAVSRGQVAKLKEANASNSTFENRLISESLVDPTMTPAEVGQWLDDAPAGDSVKVMEAISALSGMDDGAAKSGVRPVRKRRRT